MTHSFALSITTFQRGTGATSVPVSPAAVVMSVKAARTGEARNFRALAAGWGSIGRRAAACRQRLHFLAESVIVQQAKI